MSGGFAHVGRRLLELDWAEQKRLIGIDEIAGIVYLRLTHFGPQDDED